MFCSFVYLFLYLSYCLFVFFCLSELLHSLAQVAVKTLPFYKEYFGIAYPLPKMDLITIADFAAGAMENWGLITYRCGDIGL